MIAIKTYPLSQVLRTAGASHLSAVPLDLPLPRCSKPPLHSSIRLLPAFWPFVFYRPLLQKDSALVCFLSKLTVCKRLHLHQYLSSV